VRSAAQERAGLLRQWRSRTGRYSALAARAIAATSLSLSVVGGAHAEIDEAVAQALTRKLTLQGLENVAARAEGERMVVTFENRRQRWQVAGVGEVLAAVAEQLPTDTVIVLVPQSQGVPQMRLAVRVADYEAFNAGELDDGEFRRRIEAT
jgi:hypothetical protein